MQTTHNDQGPGRTALDVRRNEVEEVVERVLGWAQSRPDVRGVALVGSWARNAGRMDSDVDVVVLTDDLAQYTQSDAWLTAFDVSTVVRRQQWGVVSEVRPQLASGLEVEFGFAPPSWASTEPLDPGTRKVVRDGMRVVMDPAGVLTKLQPVVGASWRLAFGQ
ncbi:MAG: aminoglycoside 6-adenylyltransferase [Solirubrobacteraceae bacterium]|jgi:predicted nucleotidyltransferase